MFYVSIFSNARTGFIALKKCGGPTLRTTVLAAAIAVTGAEAIATDEEAMSDLSGTWAVTEIAYAEIPEEAVVTIDVADGIMKGRAACGTYRAVLNIKGDHLHKGEIERSDNDDCEIEMEEAKSNFLRILEVVDRFEVGADGGLTLLAQERPMIRATPREGD